MAKHLDLLPSIGPLPIVSDPATGREWFVLECLYDWEEPTPPEVDKFSVKSPVHLVHAQELLSEVG